MRWKEEKEEEEEETSANNLWNGSPLKVRPYVGEENFSSLAQHAACSSKF